MSVRLECEVAGVEEMHLRTGVVSLERLGTLREEERVALAPDGEQRWPLCAEVFLEFWIERDVACVVQKQVELDVVVPRPSEQCGVELVSFRRDQRLVLDAIEVLGFCRRSCQKFAQGHAIFQGWLLPVFLDRVPTLA